MILNVKYVLVGEELKPVEDVHIEITEGEVTHIGRGHVAHVNAVDLKQGVALPALVNAHVHVLDYAFPEYGINLTLEQLVSEPYGLKHRLLASLSPGELKQACADAFRKLLRCGVAVTFAYAETPSGCEIAKAAASSAGINAFVLGRPRLGMPTSTADVLRRADGLGLDSPLRYDASELKHFRFLCDRFGKIICTHVAESKAGYERGDFEAALEFMKPEVVVHGVHLNEEDLLLLAERRTSLVVCPRSNLWFNVGLPPIFAALESGVNVLLGTDNAGVIEPDIWRELEVAYSVARMQGEAEVNPRELLKAATVNLGKVRSLRASNVLAEGQRANLVVLSAPELGLSRTRNIHATIVKRGSPASVLCVIKDNAILKVRGPP